MTEQHFLPLFVTSTAIALALHAGPVQAQDTSPLASSNGQGFYATLGLGASWPQNVTGNTSVLDVPVNGSFNLGGGFAGEVGAGYDFGTVRTEVTYSYNAASLNSVTGRAQGLTGTTPINNGAVSTNAVLASAYLDIPTKSRWVPYIGGGIGYTNVGWGAYSATVAGVTATQVAGNQGSFGYQAKVGLTYLASRSTDVFVEATYQGTSGFQVDQVKYDAISSWGARLGARYRF